MNFISFNGSLLEKEQLNFYELERFRFGDAFFESILYVNGSFPLLAYHQKRVQHACQILDFDEFVLDANHFKALIQKNNAQDLSLRLRISLVRKEGFNYQPLGKKFQVLVECSEQTTRFKDIKSLGLFTEMHKPQNAYAAIKSANALLYVLGKQFAQLNKFDEVLIQNHENHWIEACSSNLFLIQDEVIMAPKHDSGCVWGVSRDFLVNLFDVKFVDVTEDLLYQADEIFLSNGIQCVQSVQYFNEKPLKNTQTLQIIDNIKAELSI